MSTSLRSGRYAGPADPLVRRLAAHNPVPPTPMTPAEDEVAERLLARLAAPAGKAVSSVSRRRRLATRIGAGAVAVAAAVTGALVLSEPASARDVLLQAADAAGQQEVTTGTYWYSRSELVAGYLDRPVVREIWVTADGGGVLRDGQFPDEHGKTLVQALEASRDRSSAFLDALPTEPDALREALLAAMPPGWKTQPGGGLWDEAWPLLSETPASPALRQALWTVIADSPGVAMVGAVTDGRGRDGVGVEFRSNGGRLELVVDTSDGALLEVRTLDDDGDVVARTTYAEQGWRSAAPVPDPPDCGPGSLDEPSC